MTNLQEKLNIYTKLSLERRVKAMKWLVRQNEEIILIAFEKQKENYFGFTKINESNKSILYLSALYFAADELYTLLQEKKKKNRAKTLHDIKDVTRLQATQFKQIQQFEKWNKLLNLKSKIIKLIDQEKLSYRQVSQFLWKYHRFEVSHSYIAIFYRKMKEKK